MEGVSVPPHPHPCPPRSWERASSPPLVNMECSLSGTRSFFLMPSLPLKPTGKGMLISHVFPIHSDPESEPRKTEPQGRCHPGGQGAIQVSFLEEVVPQEQLEVAKNTFTS